MPIVEIPIVDPKKRYLGTQLVGKSWQPRGTWDFGSSTGACITTVAEVYDDATAYGDGQSLPSAQAMLIDGPDLLGLLVKHQAALEAIQADIEAIVAARLGGVAQPAGLGPLIAAMQTAFTPEPQPES